MSTGPDIAVTHLAGDWEGAVADIDHLCRQAARHALVVGIGNDLSLPMERLEVSLVLADDRAVAKLNQQYRGRDGPTNVLSFAALDDGAALPDEGPIMLGDVVLALETASGEAVVEGKSLAAHSAHLIVHGVLHLLGFDHEEDGEADEMEGLERAILARMGIADPYRLASAPAPS